MEDGLIQAMIQCLSEGTAIEMDSRARCPMAATSKIEEFLAANCNQPVYLSEICAATGVSESTLRRCCREHLRMDPVRYLWLRRMSLLRAALLGADAANASMTGIGTDQGFWELGRFFWRVSGAVRGIALRFVAPGRPADCMKSSVCFSRGGFCIAKSRAGLNAALGPVS